jgi:hypothetical protein
LWIGLCRILEEAVESVQEFWHQLRRTEVAHKVSRFRHDEIVAMCQRLAQWFFAVGFRLLAKPVESGDLFFEASLAGHAWQFNRRIAGLRESAWHPVLWLL